MFGASQFFSMGMASQAMESPERPKARQEEKSCCLPVTVRLLELTHESAKASGGELRFHGQESEPGMLIMVAQVEAIVSRQPTCLEFSVNDSTGRIRARFFTTEPSQEKSAEEIVPGSYVNMYGQFRTSPQPHFAVQGVRLIRSADEISFHMIEVAHAALKCQLQSGSDPATPAPKALRTTQPASIEAVSPPKTQSGYEASAQVPLPQLPTPQPEQALEGALLRDAVMEILKDAGETGYDAAEVCNRLQKDGKKVSGGESALKDLLQQLVEEGDVFNTIDDDHFQAL